MVSERQLLDTVVEAARLGGWRVAHFRPARTGQGWRTPVQGDAAGFPDLVLVQPARRLVLFRELKAGRGRLRPEQRAWLDALERAGCDAAVWRPADLDAILAQLAGGTVR